MNRDTFLALLLGTVFMGIVVASCAGWVFTPY